MADLNILSSEKKGQDLVQIVPFKKKKQQRYGSLENTLVLVTWMPGAVGSLLVDS